MKYFVFGDCHGDFEALKSQLNYMGYDPHNSEHQLLGLGDYFGRAAKSIDDCYNIWQYLISEEHINKPICLRGNHESILIDAIQRHALTEIDINNGEHNTFASFLSCVDPLRTEPIYPSTVSLDIVWQHDAANIMNACGLKYWLEHLPWYHITNNYLFVHGFVPYSYDGGSFLEWYNDVTWDNCSWANTPREIAHFITRFPKGCGKTIVFGHWNTYELNRHILNKPELGYGVFFDKTHHLIGLDRCTALTGKVGGVILVED